MRRKKIAVLMASIDREYQQDFAYGALVLPDLNMVSTSAYLTARDI